MGSSSKDGCVECAYKVSELGLKTVELGQDNPNIIFTFTFEYENKIEFENVGNENENELTEYRKIQKRTNSTRNMSNMVGIRKNKSGTPTRRR
jgi:hypothetical protein